MNKRQWEKEKLSKVAPSSPLKIKNVTPTEQTWQVNLDDIESHTGRLLQRKLQPFSKAGTSTHWFDQSHVLYSKLRPYLNKVLLPSEKGLGTSELVPLLPDPKRLSREYLAYYLRSDKFLNWISGQTSGAKMPRVTMKVFWEHEIPLPPLAEQKQIAAILDAADSLRQKDQQLVEHYTALSQSLFLEMFGDLSKYKSLPMKEVSKFIDYRGKTPKKTSSGIPLLTAKNVKNGYISDEPKEYISDDDYYDWMTRGFPNENDLLFTTEAPLGQAALMPKYTKVALAQRIICIQPFSELNSRYLMYVVLSTFFKQQLFNLATGSTVKGIRSKELAKIKIPLPPIELQNQFAERIAIIEKQKQQVQTNLENSEALFNSLLQRAFTGELTANKAA